MASIGFIGVGKLGQVQPRWSSRSQMSGYDINPVEPENFTMVNTLEEAVIGQDIVFVATKLP